MVWTTTEILRIQAIETKLNELQAAMNNLCTKQQMKALLTIRQDQIDNLQTRVEELESQVSALQTFHEE